jgi:hypothetical protein
MDQWGTRDHQRYGRVARYTSWIASGSAEEGCFDQTVDFHVGKPRKERDGIDLNPPKMGYSVDSRNLIKKNVADLMW